MTADRDWAASALCASVDPELWHPERGASTVVARRICRSCEVQTECLEDALQRPDYSGIRAGLNMIERRRLRQSRDRGAA